jgi:hypothetical protein
MMIAVEGMRPRPVLREPPRMTRHSSLLQFATANAAYTSVSHTSLHQSQDVLLVLRNKSRPPQRVIPSAQLLTLHSQVLPPLLG